MSNTYLAYLPSYAGIMAGRYLVISEPEWFKPLPKGAKPKRSWSPARRAACERKRAERRLLTKLLT